MDRSSAVVHILTTIHAIGALACFVMSGGSAASPHFRVSFARALRAGKLVTSESLARMLIPHVQTDHATQYGYGFEIITRNGETVFGHNGHHLGISAQLDIYQESGKIVAVLSNYDPPTAPVVAARLGALPSIVSEARDFADPAK